MKPEAAPYNEDLVEDSDDSASTEDTGKDSPEEKGKTESAAATGLKVKCEIKELETRPGLNGEDHTKEIKAKPKKDGDEGKEDLCAMKAHKTFNREGKLSNFVLEIYSPYLREALRAVIKRYPGQHFSGEVVYLSGFTQSSALACLFHYRHELEAYAKDRAELEARMHIRLAIKYVDKEFRQAIRRFEGRVLAAEKDNNVEPSIEFRDLWMLYKPGILLYGRPRHTERSIFKAVNIHLGSCDNSPCWDVSTELFGHDGKSFGYLRRTFRIKNYDGTRRMTRLDVYPLRFEPDREREREEQLKRAKQYIALTGIHYRAYTGKAWGVEHRRTPTYWGGVQDEYPDDALQVRSRRIRHDALHFLAIGPANLGK
jgi:hypothetical protein